MSRSAAPPAGPAHEPSEALTARAVGVLFVVAGLLFALSMALPHPAFEDISRLVGIAVGVTAVGLVYTISPRPMPRPIVHLTVAAGTAAICAAIYLSGVVAGVYSSMFLWISLFTAYFFSRRASLLHLGWLLACYAAVLVFVPDPAGFSPFTRWLLMAIALGVTSWMTSWLTSTLRITEDRTARFFELSRDLLCRVDPNGYFVDVNRRWTETLGYSVEELRAIPLIEMVHRDDREQTVARLQRIFQADDPEPFENRYLAKDGSWHWLAWSATVSRLDGLIYGRATDVSERKELEREREQLLAEMESQARTDPLTGAPNRRWLADELERELGRARRRGASLSLAMLDLDRFKLFNDTFGHGAGDRLLRDTCDGWRGALRATDFLARFGGEEFVILLPACGLADALETIERVRAATPGTQTCSAGIAEWDWRETGEELIARADAALYRAKAGGRNRTVLAGDHAATGDARTRPQQAAAASTAP